MPISPDLRAVLEAAERWHRISDGAFHPGAEALTRLWNRSEREPDEAEIESARRALAEPLWTVSSDDDGTATCETSCPLTLNAIAKGFIVDRAAEAARRSDEDVDGVLLNIGGDLCVRGSVAVPVGIADPNRDAENAPPIARIRLRDAALATSGNYRRGFRINDRWRSHLIDPRTGHPAERIVSASVIAPNAADADVLATVFSLLAPDESARIAADLPDVAFLLIDRDGVRVPSARWPSYEIPTS